MRRSCLHRRNGYRCKLEWPEEKTSIIMVTLWKHFSPRSVPIQRSRWGTTPPPSAPRKPRPESRCQSRNHEVTSWVGGIFLSRQGDGHLEGESPPVHVQDHVEGVGNLELLVDVPRVGDAVPVLPAVVVNLQGLEAPAPAGGAASHQPPTQIIAS